jgi:hypothetical protein
MPTNIPIAGPLFLHVHFDLSAACQMEVNGQMHATAGMGVSGDVKLATRYKKEGFIKADGKKSKFEFEALTPNFQLDPKPYLEVSSRKQQVKGRCALQPTAVLLLEHSVGAKLSVEPYLEMQAQRASSRDRWQLDAQAGLSVHAATDVEVFGRAIGKPKEFTLFEVALTKPGDPVDAPPAPADPPPSNRPTDNAPAAVASNLPGAPKAVPLAAKSGPRLWLPWKKKR